MEVANWMDIRSDRQKGLSYTEMARKYNIDPGTAKKYAESETRPVYSLSAAKPSKLDPYKEQIAIWLEEAPYSAERILEKIREQSFDGFYGFKPVLCRPYRGQTKGKVERTVQFIRDNFMVGIKYRSLDDLNGQALAWCNKVNGKVHATTNEIPFERLKKEGLNPLKREYIIAKINLRRVQKDCLISYGGNQYSVPSEYAGKDVAVVALDNLLTGEEKNVYGDSGYLGAGKCDDAVTLNNQGKKIRYKKSIAGHRKVKIIPCVHKDKSNGESAKNLLFALR